MAVYPLVFDYPDADFSTIMVGSTSVSPKIHCLPCQKSHPSVKESDVSKINDDDNYINEIDSCLLYASILLVIIYTL